MTDRELTQEAIRDNQLENYKAFHFLQLGKGEKIKHHATPTRHTETIIPLGLGGERDEYVIRRTSDGAHLATQLARLVQVL